MRINHFKSVFLILLCLPGVALATVPAWKIIPNESSLSFTATQNGAPVTGTFKEFDGTINFDPAQLDKSNVKITVNLASVADAYNELTENLKTADWFNTATFPQATFQSSSFTKTGDKTYKVAGMLTIRDKTLPVVLSVTQDAYTSTHAKMSGTTTVKRTAFGVGQGEWADTNAVKDEVKINFTVSATAK